MAIIRTYYLLEDFGDPDDDTPIKETNLCFMCATLKVLQLELDKDRAHKHISLHSTDDLGIRCGCCQNYIPGYIDI